MIKLHGRKTSSNVAKIAWALTLIDLPFQRLGVGGVHGGNDTPRFLEMNPNGKVPVLEVNGSFLWESNAILRFLGTMPQAGALWPDDTVARAKIDAWMDWSTLRFYTPTLTAFRIATGVVDVPGDLAAAIEDAALPARIAENQLSGKRFVIGNRPSLADIALGVHVARFVRVKPLRQRFPGIAAYYQRLLEVPGYRDHVVGPLIG